MSGRFAPGSVDSHENSSSFLSPVYLRLYMGSVSAASARSTAVTDRLIQIKRNRGFSILEMLIVLLIIATISGYDVLT